jgi:hypothetical protein
VADPQAPRHEPAAELAESKEHLGGFYIIEADDLDAALVWASKTTAAVGAPIEVRPFWEMPDA